MTEPHPRRTGRDGAGCPLCGSTAEFFHRDRRRAYERCPTCSLVFVPPDYLPTPAEERAVYELHENSPADAGYRAFLSRAADAVAARVPTGRAGLDFGCGPGPTLSVMLEETGYDMEVYDPFFVPDSSVLSRTYDFVTATEVVEHLHRPAETLRTIWDRVAPHGFLVIMTKMVIDREAFSRWHYRDDETHVCFFSRASFEWIGSRWSSTPEFVGRDVVVFEKRFPSMHADHTPNESDNALNGVTQAVCYSGFREGRHPVRGDGSASP